MSRSTFQTPVDHSATLRDCGRSRATLQLEILALRHQLYRPEFAGRTLDAWAYARGVTLRFIRPGKPIENAYVESFNGKFRDECLNEHWCISVLTRKRRSKLVRGSFYGVADWWGQGHQDIEPCGRIAVNVITR